MAKRHERAQVSLRIMTQRADAFLDGLKLQLEDTKEVCAEALGPNYSTEKWIADTTALWINGAALVGALYGFPIPGTGKPPPGGGGAGPVKRPK